MFEVERRGGEALLAIAENFGTSTWIGLLVGGTCSSGSQPTSRIHPLTNQQSSTWSIATS